MAAVKKKVVKKKAAGTKVINKKVAAKKTTKKKAMGHLQMEPKLGHDPLAWITGNEENVVSHTNIVVEPEVAVLQSVEEEIIAKKIAGTNDSVSTNVVITIDEEREVAALPVKKQTVVNDQKDKTMLILPDIFGIAQADVTYQEIKKLLSSEDDIKIDASAVETVDASALQLLIALVNECKSQGKKISWHAQSDKINDSAKLLNLTELLAI